MLCYIPTLWGAFLAIAVRENPVAEESAGVVLREGAVPPTVIP